MTDADFQLQQDSAPTPCGPTDETPVTRQCGTCKFYQPSRGPTGRIRPTEKGKCGWEQPWPEKWPEAFHRGYLQPTHCLKAEMFMNDGMNCQCWEKKSA